MKQKILIVEDESKLARLMSDYLEQADFETEWLDNGLEVVDWVRRHPVDFILLDLMLPGKDGIEICKEIRQFSQVPIIMVTARIEEVDRLLGLELGADDYVCKPYSPREVLARIKAVGRRCSGNHRVIRDPAIALYDEGYGVAVKGEKVNLTQVEFQLFKIMLAQPDKVFTREQLMTQVYDDHRIVSARTIDCHIKKIRKKLAVALPGAEVIQAVYGVGYKVESCRA
ncbi:response regulator [Thalassomonas viridans]|uniref:Response regulator n=1 Tax=Thalassomonas viridans TaxID=137584 RepID=A0AAF0CA03_9GAMM|nr:response regulator [Thalassomonas viridans]WDE06001.1 response regulator [Thalassomonas viridans]